ncbi:MAG: site-2 protease family protein [Planctomycetota bacterium]|nr:site-2 protease family protein [Planctomycetota bacterium]
MDILAVSELGLWSEYILPILLLVMGLSMVIFVHELGHFVVAKLVGIKVERFALGFGKRLFGVQRGETDYCVNLVPLGGYIKMLGQEDVAPLSEQADPRAFNNKTVGQRFAVISAGVIMNVIFAAALYVVIGLAGIRFEAPVVGRVVPGSPAATAKVEFDGVATASAPASSPASSPASAPASGPATAPAAAEPPSGLQPGDTIVSVDGTPVSRLLQVKMTAILGEPNRTYRFVLQREMDGVVRTGTADLQLKPIRSPITTGSEILAFGVEAAADVVFGIIRQDGYDTPFQANDRIVAVNGKPVQYMWEIQRIAKTLDARASIVTVERGGRKVLLPLQPELDMKDWFCLKDGRVIRGPMLEGDLNGEGKVKVRRPDGSIDSFDPKDQDLVLLDILGLRPRVRASVVFDGSPAQKAGLLPGDVINNYADKGPPDWSSLVSLTKERADKETSISVERSAKEMTVTPRISHGTPIIGVQRGVDMTNLESYLKLPYVAAVGGTWMVREDLIQSGQFDKRPAPAPP